jgi:hypothetical protein
MKEHTIGNEIDNRRGTTRWAVVNVLVSQWIESKDNSLSVCNWMIHISVKRRHWATESHRPTALNMETKVTRRRKKEEEVVVVEEGKIENIYRLE